METNQQTNEETKMTRAATHKGTCQSWGREQADTRSGLAKHGYNVEWGFFSGVCSGAHHQPLELDRSRLDWTCEQLAENAAKLEAITLADIEAARNPVEPDTQPSQKPKRPCGDAESPRRQGPRSTAQGTRQEGPPA